MQKNDKWPEDYDPESPKSRTSSRRNSTSSSRRNSATKKDKDVKKKSPHTSPSAAGSSTPKRIAKPLEFIVTGRQCLKKSDRANSLPGYHRRPSGESSKNKKLSDSPKKTSNVSQSSKSRDTSLEDDMSLDLSQVSDFEDTNSKYGLRKKFTALATSTPKPTKNKARSASLQYQMQSQKMEGRKTETNTTDTFSCSRDSIIKTPSSASNYRQCLSSELDYSSVSPEYSGQSSTDLSPRVTRQEPTLSPRTQEHNTSSCCESWQDCSSIEPTARDSYHGNRSKTGEWASFWANYNNSVGSVPISRYYDQCPTPYRTEDVNLADLDLATEGSKRRSPNNIGNINHIIRNEGLHLTARETQNIIKCTHILTNVLSKAIERRSREKNEIELQELQEVKEVQEVKIENEVDEQLEVKKKTLTLELKETNIPAQLQEEKRCETATTQTDISLPNTKSAPKIFEKILRQLSKSSLDDSIGKMIESVENKMVAETKVDVTKENEKPT